MLRATFQVPSSRWENGVSVVVTHEVSLIWRLSMENGGQLHDVGIAPAAKVWNRCSVTPALPHAAPHTHRSGAAACLPRDERASFNQKRGMKVFKRRRGDHAASPRRSQQRDRREAWSLNGQRHAPVSAGHGAQSPWPASAPRVIRIRHAQPCPTDNAPREGSHKI